MQARKCIFPCAARGSGNTKGLPRDRKSAVGAGHDFETKDVGSGTSCHGVKSIDYIEGEPGELLTIRCKRTGLRFLIDSGSVCSTIPASGKDPQQGTLYAANNTPIPVYGMEKLTLDLGFARKFNHEFLKADIKTAILGADFLRSHNIIVDLPRGRLGMSVDGSEGCEFSKFTFLKTPKGGKVCSVHVSDVEVEKILAKYPAITSEDKKLPPVRHNYEHRIPTEGPPPFCRPRKLSPKFTNILRETLDELLEQGILVPSNSDYASAIHFVPKKSEHRMVGDYRPLNMQIKRDVYPIPFLSEFTAELSGKTIFSSIDLKSAYHLIPVSLEDQHKTCITTPLGAYNYTRLPFGLSNAAQSWQRFADQALRNITWTDEEGFERRVCLFVYIDDILVCSTNRETHLRDLDALFKRLDENGLKLSIHKCSFATDKLTFLGHDITSSGFTASYDKVQTILELPLPPNLGNLKRALGMLVFYAKFIPGSSGILAPLHDLLKGYSRKLRTKSINWEDFPIAKEAFSKAKDKLAEMLKLSFPSGQGSLQLRTDASEVAVGGVLEEVVDGVVKPLGFFSRKLNPREMRMSTFGRELLAIFSGVRNFEHFLRGERFTVITDHKAILGAKDKPYSRALAKESRMLEYVMQFNPDFVHVPGAEHDIPDYLSRPVNKVTRSGSMSGSIECQLTEEIRLAQKDCEELRAYVGAGKTIELVDVDGIYCHKTGSRFRPFVPKMLRNKVIKYFHELRHDGIKASRTLIGQRYIWPFMKKDIQTFVKFCELCQKTKITKHNRADMSSFDRNSSKKFSYVHADLIGPLHEIHGMRYVLTMVDRFSGWIEMVPIPDKKSETVARAFFLNWIARVGVPEIIHTDNGGEFRGAAFSSMLQNLGCKLKHSLPYSPFMNGAIEVKHRALKSSLMAGGVDWIAKLSAWLLLYRANYRAELKCSPFELVYGEPIRLPGDLLDSSGTEFLSADNYVDSLKKAMATVVPDYRKVSKPGHVDKNLFSCSKVFVRNEQKVGLDHFYKGPYLVLERHEKFFVLQNGSKHEKVSINRLKSAYVMDDEVVKLETTGEQVVEKEEVSGVWGKSLGRREEGAGVDEDGCEVNGISSANANLVSSLASFLVLAASTGRKRQVSGVLPDTTAHVEVVEGRTAGNDHNEVAVVRAEALNGSEVASNNGNQLRSAVSLEAGRESGVDFGSVEIIPAVGPVHPDQVSAHTESFRSVGLVNDGNLCCINSVMQVLASVELFCENICNLDSKEIGLVGSSRYPVTIFLYKNLTAMREAHKGGRVTRSGVSRSIKLEMIDKLYKSLGGDFLNPRLQHDVGECVTLLLTRLEEELQSFDKKSWNYRIFNRIRSLFWGEESVVGEGLAQVEPFLLLALNIENPSVVSVKEAFNNFWSKESNPTVRKVIKEPEVLLLQLMSTRFASGSDGFQTGKTTRKLLVDPVIDIIGLASFELRGVIFHSGLSDKQGHYVAAVYNHQTALWQLFNDHKVTSYATYDNCEANNLGLPYVLFYHRSRGLCHEDGDVYNSAPIIDLPHQPDTPGVTGRGRHKSEQLAGSGLGPSKIPRPLTRSISVPASVVARSKDFSGRDTRRASKPYSTMVAKGSVAKKTREISKESTKTTKASTMIKNLVLGKAGKGTMVKAKGNTQEGRVSSKGRPIKPTNRFGTS